MPESPKLMSIIIQSKRCVLREMQVKDASEFLELNADPDVLMHTGDAKFRNLDDASNFIKKYNDYSKWKMGRWVVINKENQKILGWCGLKYHPDGMVDLGFRFHKKYWNQGYATECSIACLKYGFNQLSLEFIVARAQTENKNSLRVLDKLQMKYSHNFVAENKEWKQYSLEKSDFENHLQSAGKNTLPLKSA